MGDGVEDKLHIFRPRIAERYGLVEAVIYQYLAWCIQVIGCGEYSPSLSSLQRVFTYLGRDQIRRALINLSAENEEEIYEDGKGWPALLTREDRPGRRSVFRLNFHQKAGLTHSFDPQMAQKYDVVPAILYDDLVRWMVENDRGDESPGGEIPSVYQSPSQWASLHRYVSLSSVKRSLRLLVAAGEIEHVVGLDGKPMYVSRDGKRVPIWTVPLGLGKLDRWNCLHKRERGKKEASAETKVIHVPAVYDEDIHG